MRVLSVILPIREAIFEILKLVLGQSPMQQKNCLPVLDWNISMCAYFWVLLRGQDGQIHDPGSMEDPVAVVHNLLKVGDHRPELLLPQLTC